ERETASGPVRQLLRQVRQRSQGELLDKQAPARRGRRALRLKKRKTLVLTHAQRRTVERLIKRFAQTQPHPRYYRLIDAAWRLAGNGSAGVPRFILLVEGNGSPEHNALLDLKLARPSALTSYVPIRQPAWTSEAERVVTVQTWLQAVAPGNL